MGELWFWSQPGFKSCVYYSLSVFISCGCHNKLPQTGWCKTTDIYSLIVQEVRSLKSKCQQGWFLLELWGRICSMPLSVSYGRLPATLGVPRLVDALLQSLPSLLSTPPRRLLSCVSVGLKSLSLFSCKDTSHRWIQGDFVFRSLITFAKMLFLSKGTFWGSRWTWILGRHCLSHYISTVFMDKEFYLSKCKFLGLF